MHRFTFGAAVIIGALAIVAARPALAQPAYGAHRHQDQGAGHRGPDHDHDDRLGRRSDDHSGDQGDTHLRDHDQDQDGDRSRDGDRRHGGRRQGDRDRHRRHFCWYESGWRGRGSYWCGYAWRVGRGWAGDDEGDDEDRGYHYRGYWDDGAGHRFYDSGGFGVGYVNDGR